jgi:hypothetical protein
MYRIALIIGFIGFIAAPALAQDKATIEKLNDAWTAAFNKGDAAAVAAMYTEDAYCCRRAPTWSRGVPQSKLFGGKRRSRWETRS